MVWKTLGLSARPHRLEHLLNYKIGTHNSPRKCVKSLRLSAMHDEHDATIDHAIKKAFKIFRNAVKCRILSALPD